mgnify:FL=1
MTYDYCCSRDGHGLEIPGFSAVFIQTFSIKQELQFLLPDCYVRHLPGDEDYVFHKDKFVYEEKADALAIPIVPMGRSIEKQIFVLRNEGKSPDEKNVRRFSLRGFDFEMPIEPEEDEIEPRLLKCHVNVEMSLFFGNTVSITYRFLFNGHSGTLSAPVGIDHIIALLSTWLGAEYWSRDVNESCEDGASRTNINLEGDFKVENLFFSELGDPLEEGVCLPMGSGERGFGKIAVRYKRFIYRCCTRLSKSLSGEEKAKFRKFLKTTTGSIVNDSRFAMVDLWEDIRHPLPDGTDLFSNDRPDRMTEAQIVSHIRDFHKPELIGLMTLYPGEWPYRDAEAYDDVCGENIAIDTDDLVLVNSNMSIVLGTYGRRGDGQETAGTVEKKGVNWAEHLKERARYHVSWPEYLLILQMVLAKKYVIGRANDVLIDATLSASSTSSLDLIGQNAKLSMRLSRMVLQLDVVKYSKFASHKVMFDRTTRRLNLDNDLDRLNEMMSMVDSSLHNLSDFKSMKSDFVLNFILAIISVASTFELFFQQSEMPFLTYFGIQSSHLAAVVVMVVACVTIFGILLVISKTIRSIVSRIKEVIS